jgi:23S rRNA U2552 (ribose-2'-O)-methylase RlmE/FtsJ
VKVVKPDASRKESKEIYILAMHFKGPQEKYPELEVS